MLMLRERERDRISCFPFHFYNWVFLSLLLFKLVALFILNFFSLRFDCNYCSILVYLGFFFFNKNFVLIFLIHLWILFQKQLFAILLVFAFAFALVFAFVLKLQSSIICLSFDCGCGWCLFSIREILFYTAATGPGGVEMLVVIVLLKFLEKG